MPLKIKPRGKNGTLQIEGTFQGVRVRESTGTTSRRLAAEKKNRIETEILDGLRTNDGSPDFARAANLYMDKGGERRFLKPLLLELGRMKLRDITEETVSQAAHKLYPGRTPQTHIRQIYTPINRIFKIAQKAKLCPPTNFERPSVPKRRQSIVWVSDKWLFQVCKRADPYVRACMITMSFQGPRTGEAMRVMPKDIDFDDGYISFRDTKNGEPRQSKMAAPTVRALQALEMEDGVPVFRLNHRDYLCDQVKLACAYAHVDYFTPHQFGRHTFAARFLNAGHTLKELQHAGGWRSYNVVAETYGHLERSRIDDFVHNAGANFEVLADALFDTNGNAQRNVIDFTEKKLDTGK